MQLTHGMRLTLVSLGLCVACPRSAIGFGIDEQTADYLMQYFADSDKVAVRSAVGNYSLALKGNAALSFQWNNERVVVPAVDAPVGSQEAVDAITTASRPIAGNAYEDFIKVRNEFQGSLSRGHTSVDYYLSQETDYLGQQVAASYNRDLGGDQLNISLGSSYGWDAIEPLADDDTQSSADTKTTIHWNAVATRILSPSAQVRVGVEYNIVDGLQHNPYRNVYAGGGNEAERHPDHRQRRDAFVKFNQFFANRSSLKLHYRLYNDDWGIDSHETGTTLSQYVTHGVFASYQYRYYTQTDADFYRDDYLSSSGVDGFLTGDYRMAALSSHLFGAALDFDLDALAAGNAWLRPLELRLNYERYFNSNNYSANIVTTQLVYRF